MMRVPKLCSNPVWILFFWVCFMESTKVNCRLQAPFQSSTPPKKDSSKLAIETSFKLPAPVPDWPTPGTSFAKGEIDLGKLRVHQITSFNKVWTSYEYGPGNLGATFFEPTSIPEDFFMLGCYGQPNNEPFHGWVLVAEDASSYKDPPALQLPIDYTLLWSSESHNITQDGVGYFWLPVPPDGYTAVGHVVTTSPQKPPLDKIRVVRTELTESVESDTWIWGAYGFHLYSSRPVDRGIQALGVALGTFIAGAKDRTTVSLSCLSNLDFYLYPSMPLIGQLAALIQTYAPVVYFDPDEKYLPSGVDWFFENGALLYAQGEEFNPAKIESDGSNLPQNGFNDGTYWIDLPKDATASENLKKGNLQSAKAYMHIKPYNGGTFTDIAVWLFYPYNGPGQIRIGAFTIPLREIGQHVSDWEHVTLRISNLDGELKSVYYSQHSNGIWVSPWDLEFEGNSNKPVVYASKGGHASYPKAGEHIHTSAAPTILIQDKMISLNIGGDAQEKITIGAQNDTSKSDLKLDTADHFWFLGLNYTVGITIDEEPWVNFAREWGPRRFLNVAKWLILAQKHLPQPISFLLGVFIRSLPPEVLGEEGPVGPKWKDNWFGDERV